jgi:preprotein translocase subunit SecA
MLVQLRDQVTSVLSHIELRLDLPPPLEPAEMFFGGPQSGGGQFAEIHEREPAMAEDGAMSLGDGFSPAPPRPQRSGGNAPRGGGQPAGPRSPWAGTPRNATCPCGSGKKFKHCHGRI